jgi:hypothetical protein
VRNDADQKYNLPFFGKSDGWRKNIRDRHLLAAELLNGINPSSGSTL